MNNRTSASHPQSALWNGPSGHAWVEEQAVLDHMFKPLADVLVDAVRADKASRVLDVGCGTGATTLAVAQLLGTHGHCIGTDISAPMITAAVARARLTGSSAEFICADAQHHAFQPARFDMLISRFGVMFFEQPVQAFSNLKHAMRDGASLCLIAWRSAAENPFMTIAERMAAPLLPDMPARQPGAPGQFAFADKDRVTAILKDSGWSGIDIEPIDVECAFPETELTGYFTRLGPVGLALQQCDERTRTRVIETVRPAYDAHVRGTDVRYTAACWLIRARASSGSK